MSGAQGGLEGAGGRVGLRPASVHLMVSGLGFWGLSVGGAHAPGVLRAALLPNAAEAPHFELVPAAPLGAPILWTVLVLWCVSWAFVVGHLAAVWAAHHGRPSWAAPSLLLLSLASPLVFGFALSALVPLATHDAFHGNGLTPYLPAVALQLLISKSYSFMVGWRPHAELQLAAA